MAMTVAELARLFGVTKGRMCLILQCAGYKFAFGPLRPTEDK